MVAVIVPSELRSILITTCGHALHYQCYAQFISATARAGSSVSPNIDPTRGDLQCPLCKCVGNVLVPIVPTRGATRGAQASSQGREDNGVRVWTDELLSWAASAIPAEVPSPFDWGSLSPAAASSVNGARGAQRGAALRDIGLRDEEAADALAPFDDSETEADAGLDADGIIPTGDAIPVLSGRARSLPQFLYNARVGSIPLRDTAFARAVTGDRSGGEGDGGAGASVEADERAQRSRMCLDAVCEIRHARRDIAEVQLAPGAETPLQRGARREALQEHNASPWAPSGIAGAADALVSACAGAAHTLVVAELNASTIAHSESSAAGGGGASGSGASGEASRATLPPSPLRSTASDNTIVGIVSGVLSAARCALRNAQHELQRGLEWRVAANLLNVHVPAASAATVLRMRDSVLLGHALLLAVVAAESGALDAIGAAAAAIRTGLLARITRCVVVEYGHATMARDESESGVELSVFARFWAFCEETRAAASGVAYDARLDHPLPRAPRVQMTERALHALVAHTCAPFIRCIAIAARALNAPWSHPDVASESLIDEVVAPCVGAGAGDLAGGGGVSSPQGALVSRWCGAWIVSEIGERATVEYKRLLAAWMGPELGRRFESKLAVEHPALLIEGLSSAQHVVPERTDAFDALAARGGAAREDFSRARGPVRCLNVISRC